LGLLVAPQAQGDPLARSEIDLAISPFGEKSLLTFLMVVSAMDLTFGEGVSSRM
jgi:hypothetical protein